MESMLTARQVAELLGVHENWVYDQAASGVLPSYKIGGVRRFDAGRRVARTLRHRAPRRRPAPRALRRRAPAGGDSESAHERAVGRARRRAHRVARPGAGTRRHGPADRRGATRGRRYAGRHPRPRAGGSRRPSPAPAAGTGPVDDLKEAMPRITGPTIAEHVATHEAAVVDVSLV